MPSTVAITLSTVPSLVMVLAAVMVTMKTWLSPVSKEVAVKPSSVRGVPSNGLLLLLAVMVTDLHVTVSVPFEYVIL